MVLVEFYSNWIERKIFRVKVQIPAASRTCRRFALNLVLLFSTGLENRSKNFRKKMNLEGTSLRVAKVQNFQLFEGHFRLFLTPTKLSP